jgi:small-conductance mechanosensitive channel
MALMSIARIDEIRFILAKLLNSGRRPISKACFCVLITVALIAGSGTPAFGQDQATAPRNNDGDTNVRLAGVVIDGETLFSVRGVTAHPAERRAQQIKDRILTVAMDSKIDSKSLTLEDHPGATWILAQGQLIMAVLDEDAAIEDLDRGPLAELYRTRIGRAIEEYREDRRAEVLWSRALYTLGATVLLVIVMLAGRWIFGLIHAGLERRYRARIESLEGRSHHLVKVDQVARVLHGLLILTWSIGTVVVVYAWLHYVLSMFPWTRGFASSLFGIIVDPLKTMGMGLVGMIPNLVFLAILLIVTRYAVKMIRSVFDALANRSLTVKNFDPEWAEPTYRIVRLLAFALAVVVAYPYIPGSESGAFKGVTLFAGVIFSLGSSSFIGNIIAGYSMTYRRPFRVGDRVKIGEYTGDVEEVRLFVTRLRTVKNEEVVVPNSKILDSEITNYSSLARERGLILHTTVGIRYETPWRQVEAILLEAAARTEGLSRDTAPFVLKKELGTFCVIYELNVYCDEAGKMILVYTQLNSNILDTFNEYGIQIMTPSYEGDTEQLKVVPREHWYAAPARPPEVLMGKGNGQGPKQR